MLDWELTLKCNLDCDYCETGLYGGHDNSLPHPPLAQCLPTIDFMYQYVDLYMRRKSRGLRHVVLNVYGGESLHHPDIVTILEQARQRHEPYKHKWHLTVTTTTNAIITPQRLTEIIPLIDEFTVSYHTNNTAKQKQQFRQNLLQIQSQGRAVRCVVLMHNEPSLFADAQEFITWLQQHSIPHLPRQLDRGDYEYGTKQVQWFGDLYNSRSQHNQVQLPQQQSVVMTDVGRACCGGRQLCENQDRSEKKFFVSNHFPGWACSVDHFFLYVKQVNGEIYTNKDCKMNFSGDRAPIGNLQDTQTLLAQCAHRLETGTSSVIRCHNQSCLCGLCAPKARDWDTYTKIMRKYEISYLDLHTETQRQD